MKRARIVFVTGTDTGVGKTLLAALLLHHLRRAGVHALAMKPFCSGGDADVRLLQSLQAGELSDREMNPYYFAKPVAPLVEQRAKKNRRSIKLSEVLEKITGIAERCECLIVEGSGGLLVPLGPGFTVLDLIRGLKCSVVIAARDRLGTINHTLLTVGALRAAGVKRQRISVVLMSQGASDISCASNEQMIRELISPVPVLKIPFLGTGRSPQVLVKSKSGQAKKALTQLGKLVSS